MVPVEIILAVVSSLISAIISGIAAFFVYKLQAREHKRELEEVERKENERRNEEKRQKEYDALKDGVRSLLRDRLIQSMLRYEEQGWIEASSLENIGMMYSSYHFLGGNGLVSKLYKEVQELSIVDPSKTNDGGDKN